MRGSLTGVYVGFQCIAMQSEYPHELQLDSRKSHFESGLWIGGTGKNMYANRISFCFDLKGPSFVVDTACSSSLVAFDLAVTDLRLGKCDQAIVGTTQLNLKPYTNLIFQNNQLNAKDGISKVWDKDADGFVRGESVSCLFLQRKGDAKRIYATVVHSKNNIDGYKKSGNFFPSKEFQQRLMEDTYIEAGINPHEIGYFEAHGTGTKAGDPEEAEAIYRAFCTGRKDKLLVGLLKSNIGHGEGTSGLASIIKSLISFENKKIAANLNLKTIKPSIARFCPPLVPVTENLDFEPNLCGVNSFGLGGVNAHAILKANKKELSSDSHLIANKIPRLVNYCGRTQEAVDIVFDFIQKNPKKVTRDFLALLSGPVNQVPSLQSQGFPFRGSMVIKEKGKNADGTIHYEYAKETSQIIGKEKPVWFLFSGMGSQWCGMAKAMMEIDKFAESIHKCADVMKQYKIDLMNIILSEDKNIMNSIVNPFLAITACQIALFDVLNEVGLKPDGIIGHSFGEIACAYADGCMNLEQTMLCSYWRGKVVEDSTIPKGKMAAVGLSYEQAIKKCPKNVYVACDNAHDSVTISGIEEDTIKFLEQLKSEGVFVRDIVGWNLKPYHSAQLKPVAPILTKLLQKVIPEPKKRSKKWVSTSVQEKDWDTELAQYASAEYYVNNLVKPVLFTSAMTLAPQDAIVIEIAPHALFASLIKRSLNQASYVGLMKRDNNQNNLEMFISALGKMYQLGMNPEIENLYPKVQYPVARGTQSIGSLIKWDHKDSYLVKKYPDYYFRSTASDMHFEFSLDEPDDAFIQDHTIEGRPLFPATGYLMLAWRRVAAQRGCQWYELPVVFQNVQFRRAVLFEKGKMKLTVRYIDPTGEFVVLNDGNVAAFGKVLPVKAEEALQLQHLAQDTKQIDAQGTDDFKLNNLEFYRELKIRGYDYGPKFQGVVESKYLDTKKAAGKVRYTNTTDFIAFLDATLQLLISVIPIRTLFIPVSLQSLRCDPVMMFEAIKSIKKNIEVKETVLDKEVKEFMSGEEEGLMDDYKETVKITLEEFEEKVGAGKDKWYSEVPFIVDLNLRSIITKGLEIEGIIPVGLPRKFLTKELRLEKYSFIPHQEDNAIENYDKNQLTKYINVCSAICKKILEKTKFNINTNELINNLKNVKVDDKLIEEMTIQIHEDHTLLNCLNSILTSQNDVNRNVVDCNELIDEIRQKSEKLEFDLSKDILNLVGKNERLIRPLLDTVNENVTPIKELKVLETNTTNGIIGRDIIQTQTETFIVSINIGYTVAHKDTEKIKTIEELQGTDAFNFIDWNTYNCDFPENVKDQVNLIIHRDSFDLWSLDFSEYFNSALKILKENGFVLGVFRSKITQPEIILNELMENAPIPSEKELNERILNFEKMALEKGFKLISKKTDSMLFTVVLFRKMNKNLEANKQTVFEVKTGKYEEWLEQLKELVKEHKFREENENIWLHAHDAHINGIIGLAQCLRMESGGDKIRYIFDMDNKLPKKIDFNSAPFKDILENNLVMNVFKDGRFGAMKHLSLPKDDDQIETTEAYVNVMQRGDLSSLQWFDGRNLKNPLASTPLKDIKSTIVDIYYSSLNFKDVMMATGRVAPGPEGGLLDCLLGCEFAGRRRDTGERVIGMSLSFGIATEAKTNEPLLMKIPDHWSMEEAATVYTVYMTCWYGLIERAQLEEGESILIHSGTGGIGQSAINICQHYKCKIFVTVSTQEKRDFLKKNYGLTDDQMFSSRDTNFEKEILRATDGKGVDLVLNSLAEDKLLASFRCVGDDGRFVEIGKYDFQMNNPLPMFAFIRNITFHGVALDRVSYLAKKPHLNIFRKFESWMYDGIKSGMVKPFNRTIFPVSEAKEAFKHMMTGKHIGKVLIKIRDEEPVRGPLKAKPIKMMATAKTWFDPEKVYILIGGLGGMGIEIVYWMMLRGATKVLVTSRSGIKSNSQRLFFKQIQELGKVMDSFKLDVKVSKLNVIDEHSASELIKEGEKMGKIGGVFNLAVVLHDALFENQTIETYNDVCKPKVDATINLDKLTRKLPYKIDYFIVFSSVTCGRGNTGQSPYGYANSVMERICEQRAKDGHHGLAIQWGPIGDVGVLADTFDDEKIKAAGLILQRLPSWIYVLDRYLQCKHPVVGSLIRMDKQFKSGTAEENMMKQLWSSLGIDPKTTPNHVQLGELGMESFVAVELQQRLERDYDISLSLNEIKRVTIGELKEFEAGNTQKVKQYAADIKAARARLSKLKFELTNEPVTKLNDVTKGKPIYVLPPIESIFGNFSPLIQLLSVPVYGLNWTYEMENLKSIKEIALHYQNLMKKLEPSGEYTMLTMSLGSVLGLRMAYKKAPIDKLIIIDTFLNDKMFVDLEEEKHHVFDQMLRFINRNVPKSFQERIKTELYKSKGNEDEKTNILFANLREIMPASQTKDFDLILKGGIKKTKMIMEFKDKYMKKYKKADESVLKHKAAHDKLKRRIKSDLIIIKSSDNAEHNQEIEDQLFKDYAINKEVRDN